MAWLNGFKCLTSVYHIRVAIQHSVPIWPYERCAYPSSHVCIDYWSYWSVCMAAWLLVVYSIQTLMSELGCYIRLTRQRSYVLSRGQVNESIGNCIESRPTWFIYWLARRAIYLITRYADSVFGCQCPHSHRPIAFLSSIYSHELTDVKLKQYL